MGKDYSSLRSYRTWLWLLVQLLVLAWLTDWVVESWATTPLVRWAGLGAAALAIVVLVVGWERSAARGAALAMSLLPFGLGCLTAFTPGSMASPQFRLLAMPGAVAIEVLPLLALVVTGILVIRLKLNVWVRAVVAILLAYAAIPFGLGLWLRKPLGVVVNDATIWSKIPYWLKGGFLGSQIFLPFAALVFFVVGVRRLFKRNLAAGILTAGLAALMISAMTAPELMAQRHLNLVSLALRASGLREPTFATGEAPVTEVTAVINPAAAAASIPGDDSQRNSAAVDESVIAGPGAAPKQATGAGPQSPPSGQQPSEPAAAGAKSCCDDVQKAIAEIPAGERDAAYRNERDERQARLARQRQFLDRFPRSLFDLDALNQSLDPKLQTRFEFVRDAFAYEPYSGVLKAARGMLLTSGGNDLDRALLLARLLEPSGVASRIARGLLPPEQAELLRQRAAKDPDGLVMGSRRLPAELPSQAFNEPQKKLAHDFEAAAVRRGDQLTEQIERHAKAVEGALHEAGWTAAEVEARQVEATQGLRDHFWLQANVDGQWVDLDASFPGARVGRQFCPVQTTFELGDVPEELKQRLEMRLVAVRLKDAELKQEVLLTHRFDAAELMGTEVRMAIQPIVKGQRASLAQFQPVLLAGNETYNGRSFHLREQASSQSQNPEMPSAGGLLGGFGGEAEPTPVKAAARSSETVLVQLYLEVVSTGPQLAASVFQRMIVDRLDGSSTVPRLDPSQSDDRTIELLPVLAWDIAIAAGAYHPVFVLENEYAALAANADFERQALESAYSGTPLKSSPTAALSAPPELLHYFMSSDLARHESQASIAPHSRVLHIRPRVAIYRHGFTAADSTHGRTGFSYQEGIDLVNAPFAIIGPAAEQAALAIRLGVADTALERCTSSDRNVFNTIPLMDAAALHKISLKTLKPGMEAIVAALKLATPWKNAVRRELQAGNWVMIPAEPVPLFGKPSFGWWSLDPRTGNALGKMNLGSAQGLTETAQLHERIGEWTETFAKFYGAFLQCYMEAMASAMDMLPYGENEPTADGVPLPNVEQLADCIIKAACDAIAELMAKELAGGAFAKSAEAEIQSLRKIIFEWAVEKGTEKGTETGLGKLCEGMLHKGLE